MDKLIEYQIPYKGLSIGKHDYDFHATKKFFADMQVDTIKGGDLKIKFELDKQNRLMQADISIIGYLVLVCDRCLEDYNFEIDVEYNQIFKFGNTPENHNDDLVYLSDTDFEINVAQIIIENILLQIPIRKIHPDDEDGNSTCKAEQLNLISDYSERKHTDSRWDALKNIKFDD